ncbi:hypothetical protein [Schleiferia thermophila]|jgi:cell division protein FtsL|uniref:Uncharacterized protein n=1 Tax=Schleiferia thermophila TaxID=884107 RepID=A0A369A7N7_9FLAO|nr:hypothetical protein [Schleiferia thermophila]KFD38629.1 hypothetical protein AT05_09065 [Schleiferia thermophila str. Yellowstone]RCX05163.1 hypothetical protein DES35_101446 [Schleiferia thermophila]
MNPKDKARRSIYGRFRRKRPIHPEGESKENETVEKIFVISLIVIILVIAYFLSR